MNQMNEVLFSLDAERGVLGALIAGSDRPSQFGLDPSDFYVVKHGWIFDALLRLDAGGKVINFVTVSEKLRETGKFEEVGGSDGLMSLTEFPLHEAKSYAEIVKAKSRRRHIMHSLSEAARATAQPDTDINEAAAKLLENLLKDSGNDDGARPIGEALTALYDEIEDAYNNPREYFGIPTGLTGFDRITSGLQRGELFMLTGEPGVGKSSLAMQLVIGAARGTYTTPGTAGVVYQLEMRNVAVVRRAISYHAKIEAKKLRKGDLNAEEWSRFNNAMETFTRLPVLMSDRTDWTTMGIRADVARLKHQHDIGWVLIDYMALLKDDMHLDSTERSALVSDRVHHIAKDFDVAVIAVHDMTKAGMSGQISGQAALAGSRRVTYNADSIASLTKLDGVNKLRLTWTKFREDTPDQFLDLSRGDGYAHFEETHKGF